MKKILIILFALVYILSFSACCIVADRPDLPENYTSAPEQTDPVPETDPSPQPEETQPEHSKLYIPDLEVDEIILYFNEVCLDAEFVMGGDPSRLQKWVDPIIYQLNGDYTQEDLDVLHRFAGWLNSIEGFPGIYESANGEIPNLQIYFCTQQTMTEILGENFTNMDGGVTFWYDNDEIYDATICYRTEIDQYLRNSVILEEIYNGLGPVQDTERRSDSIIYSGYSDPQELTQVDEVILKLLYHPDMKCGMNAEECENIIRRLYY